MHKRIIFLLLFFSLAILPTFSKAYSSSFDTAYLRLGSQSANSTLSGTICAQTSSSGIEAKVIVTFPDAFTISTNVDNWAANTSNLPSSATAWPGVGATASSVSNKSVTFASGDLATGILYCFNLSTTSSTTGAGGSDQAGTIVTKNSSNITIDTTTYAVAIVNNNQINVTASVPPQVSDLPIVIEPLDLDTQLPQNTVLSYKITYGLTTTPSFPLTIQAQWSKGTIEGNPTPSVNILDYVTSSASNAYGNTPPVIDTVNNTITWTISSIPGNTTNQTVTFQLKTNDSYTGDGVVNLNVATRTTSESTVTPDQTVSQTYLYNTSLAPTPTTTSAPTSTPIPGTSTVSVTSAPTPTTAPQAFGFSNIYVYSLSQSQAQIDVSTNQKSSIIIAYGTSATDLNQNVSSSASTTERVVTLANLLPNTNYYFKVISTDSSGNQIRSDIYTFKTAVISEAPVIDLQTLVVISNNNILIGPGSQTTVSGNKPGNNVVAKPIIVVPVSSEFTVHFSLTTTLIKSAQAFIVNKNVLAASTTTTTNVNTGAVELVETSPGVLTGKLTVPDPGNYDLDVRVIDYNGNVAVQKIADLKVVSKFTILDKKTNKPVENARVILYIYQLQARIYTIISSSILSIANPSFSHPDGTVDIILSQGKYRAEILALGYDPTSVNFTIAYNSNPYPTVYLNPQPFNIVTTIQYYWGTLSDSIIASQIYIRNHASSSRLFDLLSMEAVFVFLIVSLLSISARTHIELFYLPYFLIYKLTILIRRERSRIVFGKVVDSDTNLPLSRVNVSLMDGTGQRMVANLKTNKLGEFYYPNKQGEKYKINVIKEGFVSPPPYDFINDKITEMPIIINLEEEKRVTPSLFKILLIYAEDLLGMCMEALILLGLLVQTYFIFTFGLLRILPFILLTILNIILVFTYLYRPKGLSLGPSGEKV